MDIAIIRYHEVVMWKKPGGHHHVKILHRGDKVEVLQGWAFSERTWSDKRYVKVLKDNSIGYVLAEALSDHDVPVIQNDFTEEV